ncbi:MAG: glycosyltransferase family 2 protein [Candidatus Hydrothermarchaeales archaeon]
MDISIIIPVYNEENSISEILGKVLKLRFDNLEREVIVVDDGSTDRTPEILKGFVKEPIKIITHEKNLGKGMAIRTGLSNSTGSIVAMQDSDMEYDPSELPNLVNHILNGAPVVYGSRFLGSVKNMRFHFYLGNRFLSLFTRFLYGAPITDMETGFKVFRREAIEGIDLESTGFEIEPELTAKILRKSYRIKEVPINYIAREKQQKKITVKDGILALWALIKYRFR